jgi:hypothetical protein
MNQHSALVLVVRLVFVLEQTVVQLLIVLIQVGRKSVFMMAQDTDMEQSIIRTITQLLNFGKAAGSGFVMSIALNCRLNF